MSLDLSPEKALIFRITHRDNVSWILKNGLHCRNSDVVDPSYVSIGNADLIDRRNSRSIDAPPGGTLSDYVPFYFTPCTPMLLNIITGRRGLIKRSAAEIVVVVSSLNTLQSRGVPFVFSDRHAYLKTAQFFRTLPDLVHIDWPLLQAQNFKRDSEDPERFERYQAEALVYRHVPTQAILGIACFNDKTAAPLKKEVEGVEFPLKVVIRPKWYPR